MNARFIALMEELGHTGYSLSRELGTSEAVISNIRKGKNLPNIQLVLEVLKKYEVVNPSWLLTGKGSMFLQDVGSSRKIEDRSIKIHQRLARLEHLVERSLTVQVERNLLVDQAHSMLEKQVKKLESDLTRFKKAYQKNV